LGELMNEEQVKTKSELIKELKKQRQKVAELELALESSGLGLWDHDLVNDRVTRNERWAEMLGYQLEEIDSDGDTWRKLIHPDDIPLVNKVVEDHEAGRIPFFEVEHRLKAKSGEWKWILNWGRVVERDKDGRPLRAAGTHLDITERKQTEEERLKLEAQVQQAQKYESLNVMASSIAHHFNNLLMVVLGNLELALFNLSADSSICQNIAASEKAAKRAAELSNLMLTYVGQSEINMQVIDISEIVTEMMGMLELAHSQKTVLRFDPTNKPALFKGDISLVRQVVMNLVTNAAEAVGDTEGTIILSTGTMFCDHSSFQLPFQKEDLPEGHYVYFQVTDTGCGMNQETQDRIYDPFFSSKFRGRGLGMAIVLGIVRAHKGAIHLDSQPGKGTTIRVLFRSLESAETKKAPVEEEEYKWKGKGTVLMVDDEQKVLEVGKKMLERLGLKAITTTSALEVVEIFQKQSDHIDCVFIDLTMPQMNGVELFYKLKQIKADIPVIISSGYTEDQTMDRFKSIQPEGFIHKPYRLRELAVQMEMIMGETRVE
jgi:two-component system cell cycle sensor histidine kinase/response regulator CckA